MGRSDKRKASRDSRVLRQEKRIPWNKPFAGASRKLRLLESDLNKNEVYLHLQNLYK